MEPEDATAPPTDEAFELAVLFLHELRDGYGRAREALDELSRDPEHGASREQLRGFFHWIAGTAQAVDLNVFGHLAAVCERVCDLVDRQVLVVPQEAVKLYSEGLEAAAAVLEGQSSPDFERTIRRTKADTLGVTLPSAMEEGRRLSKVLVVDDDIFSARLIDSCLSSAGFMSSFCTDSRQALRIIERELPDLILLDLLMPGIDGFEVCRRVRAHPALQLTPIIFVSRKTDVRERVRGLEVGANDYITKPFEPVELLARVRSHLQRLATLREMAIRDGLTRCYNHKYFRVRLEQEVARAQRHGEPLSLAVLDIDHFKTINDRYGHPAGDGTLVHLANLIMASVRSIDVVARYGGDEFAILLVHATAEEAAVIARRIRARIAEGKVIADGEQPDEDEVEPSPAQGVTVSIGITQLLPDEPLDPLLERADRALYAAKKGGRNRVELL